VPADAQQAVARRKAIVSDRSAALLLPDKWAHMSGPSHAHLRNHEGRSRSAQVHSRACRQSQRRSLLVMRKPSARPVHRAGCQRKLRMPNTSEVTKEDLLSIRTRIATIAVAISAVAVTAPIAAANAATGPSGADASTVTAGATQFQTSVMNGLETGLSDYQAGAQAIYNGYQTAAAAAWKDYQARAQSALDGLQARFDAAQSDITNNAAAIGMPVTTSARS
jgi:hypothetical protein